MELTVHVCVLRLPGAFFQSRDQRLTTALPSEWNTGKNSMRRKYIQCEKFMLTITASRTEHSFLEKHCVIGGSGTKSSP